MFFFFENSHTEIEKVNMNFKRDSFDTFYNQLQRSNLIIIGLRQIGKTFLSKQIVKQMVIKNNWKYDDVVYINLKMFDDVSIEGIIESFVDVKYKAVIFDEIQVLKKWTNLVQVLSDMLPNCKFIFTGSNAFSLMHNNAIGRARTYFLNPLNFFEYSKIYNDEDFETFLKYGSLPKNNNYNNIEIQYKELSYDILVDKVISEDVEEQIDRVKFKNFFRSMKNYIKNEVKVIKIDEDSQIKSKTRNKYLNILHQSRLMQFLPKYQDKNIKTKNKIYYNDKSLIFRFNNNYSKLNNNDKGALIENLIFNTLDNKFNKVYGFSNIFYYKPSKEIDFIIPEQKLLIEVKYKNITKIEWAKEVEQKELLITNNLKDYSRIIVSNQEKEIKIGKWKIMPIKKFLNEFR